MVSRFIQKIQENENESLKLVLNKILFLACYNLIDKYSVYFYQGGYFAGERPITLIRETILSLCSEMKDEAVSLVDALAPPDYVLNSPLGVSDGYVYKKLYNTMIEGPGAFERLSWYDDFMDKKPFGHLRSKI